MNANHCLPDEDLVSATRQDRLCGESVFAELYRRHRPWILQVCRRFLPDSADAEDACQWTFLRAFQGLKSYQGRSAFKTWLYRIAVNVCLSQRTRLLQRCTHEIDLCDASDDFWQWHSGPRTPARRMEDYLEGLPKGDCEILTLHLFCGWTFEEIAAQTGLTGSGAKMRYYRALRRLRRRWAGNGAPAAGSRIHGSGTLMAS